MKYFIHVFVNFREWIKANNQEELEDKLDKLPVNECSLVHRSRQRDLYAQSTELIISAQKLRKSKSVKFKLQREKRKSPMLLAGWRSRVTAATTDLFCCQR